MFSVPIDINSITLSDEEARKLYALLHTKYGCAIDETRIDELNKSLARKRETIERLETKISTLKKELEVSRHAANQLRKLANSARKEFAGRYAENKRLRFEIVELKRKLREQGNLLSFVMRLVEKQNATNRLIRALSNRTVEEKENLSVNAAKNVRDRMIMDSFVVANGDDEDLYIMCRVCHNRGFTATRMDGIGMEFVPNGVTGLSLYNAMRGHWDRHHKAGEN